MFNVIDKNGKVLASERYASHANLALTDLTRNLGHTGLKVVQTASPFAPKNCKTCELSKFCDGRCPL